jgi:hypothetical protein
MQEDLNQRQYAVFGILILLFGTFKSIGIENSYLCVDAYTWSL